MATKPAKFNTAALLRDTITTTLWSTFGKFAGFMIPFFIAAWFGASEETDAFFFAYGVILFLSGVFAPVVENVIVPYLIELKTTGDTIDKFVSAVFVLCSLFLAILSVLLFIFAKSILRLITDFNIPTLHLVYLLLLEILPLIFFLTWTSILAGILNAHKRFSLPAISPGFRAVINLIIIYSFKDIFYIHAIPIGYVVGEFFRMGILFYYVRKLNLFRIRFLFLLDQRLILFFKTALFQIAGMLVIGINPFVDKSMASWLGEGSITILFYGDRLYMIPVTFVVSGLLVTLIPHWSDLYHRHGVLSLVKNIRNSSLLVISIFSPLMILLIVYRNFISNMIFGIGLSQEEVSKIAWVWVCYLAGFIPYILGLILVQAHLVFKNTRSLFYLSAMNCFFNIFLNYLLMQKYNVTGIALSTSVTSIITTTGLYISFSRMINATKTTNSS